MIEIITSLLMLKIYSTNKLNKLTKLNKRDNREAAQSDCTLE